MSTLLDMPRVVPAGQPNPNTKVVYTNLQEKIKDAIQRNGGMLPITITAGDRDGAGNSIGCITEVKPKDIVGQVIDIDDTTARCELNVFGTELLMHGKLHDKGIQFCYLAADTRTDQVDRVIKAALAPLSPQFKMFDVKVSGDICIENSETSEKN